MIRDNQTISSDYLVKRDFFFNMGNMRATWGWELD